MLAKLLFPLLVMLSVLTGCVGSRTVLNLDAGASGDQSGDVVPIFVATNRVRSGDRSLPYSAERSQSLNFAEFDISIPRNRRPGTVPTANRAADPERVFTARSYHEIPNRQQFIQQLDQALLQRPAEDREILIFVHGYNNNFADSLFRAAQISHDFNVRAVTLHYAWPSAGSLPLYVYDRDSAVVGRGGLAETIRIAAQTKAKRIILVGHSMGAYVVMEALRDLAMSGQGRYLDRLGGVVLAAPDIDLDAFQSQVGDIGTLPRPFVILISRQDRALSISRRIAGGHPRVGSGSDIARLQAKNITVLDASNLDGGSHSVFANSPTMISLVSDSGLMRHLIKNDEASAADAILSDSGSALEGAAALTLYLPTRILSGVVLATQPR